MLSEPIITCKNSFPEFFEKNATKLHLGNKQSAKAVFDILVDVVFQKKWKALSFEELLNRTSKKLHSSKIKMIHLEEFIFETMEFLGPIMGWEGTQEPFFQKLNRFLWPEFGPVSQVRDNLPELSRMICDELQLFLDTDKEFYNEDLVKNLTVKKEFESISYQVLANLVERILEFYNEYGLLKFA